MAENLFIPDTSSLYLPEQPLDAVISSSAVWSHWRYNLTLLTLWSWSSLVLVLVQPGPAPLVLNLLTRNSISSDRRAGKSLGLLRRLKRTTEGGGAEASSRDRKQEAAAPVWSTPQSVSCACEVSARGEPERHHLVPQVKRPIHVVAQEPDRKHCIYFQNKRSSLLYLMAG